MKIRDKIILGSAIGALITVVGMGFFIERTATGDARVSLEESAKNSLIAVRNSKKEQVENLFSTITGQLSTYSNNQMTIDAMSGFTAAFDDIGKQVANVRPTQALNTAQGLQAFYTDEFAEQYKTLNNGAEPRVSELLRGMDARTIKLQELYISNNASALGAKDELIAANDGSRYSALHQKYHPFMRSYLKQFGYYDIFLVNNSGDIVYSVFKEIDYATNLVSGAFANSGLGRAYRASNSDSTGPNDVKIIDFQSYFPSYDGAAAFFSSPIYNGNTKLGVLIMQAPVDRLNNLMTSNKSWKNVGLGDSGETYIVGKDNLLRNDSRFLIDDKANYLEAIRKAGDPNLEKISARNTSIGLQNASSTGISDALNGNEGFNIFPDYRNVSVLSAYAPLNIPGLDWVLMSEIDEEEAFRPVEITSQRIFRNTLLIGLGALLLFSLGAFFLIRSITNPLNKLSKTMGLVAEGDLTARAKMTSGDELEDLGNVFDGMLNERVTTMRESEKQNKDLNQSVIALMDATAQLADRDLTIEVPVAEDVTGSVSDALNMMVEETSEVLTEIVTVSKQVDDSVRMVQAQTNESRGASDDGKLIIKSTIDQLVKVSDSIKKIGGLVLTVSSLANKVQEASTVTAATVNKNIDGMNIISKSVAETEERMTELGKSSYEIGNIVDIINTLSERTNILAVSASMQAANAGEAGLEFAVIAEEIKRISESSKKSTFEITELVKKIQIGTSKAISNMSSTSERVSEGVKLASEAGQEMNKTQSNAIELAEAINRISDESDTQNEANTSMMIQANKVLQSTEKTSDALEKQTEQTMNLVAYAQKLRSEVGSFKLPM